MGDNKLVSFALISSMVLITIFLNIFLINLDRQNSGENIVSLKLGEPQDSIQKQSNAYNILNSEDSVSYSSSSSGPRKSKSSQVSDSNNEGNNYEIPNAESPIVIDDPQNPTKEAKDEQYMDVIVLLKDDLKLTASNLQEKQDEISMKQNKVLSQFSSEEFKVGYKYKTISGFSGKIRKDILHKLEQNSYVEEVYEDPILQPVLTESVPLINADDVWNLGHTGSGSVVCVVDSGVDYAHPDLGGCTDTYSGAGNIVPLSFESPHPYSNWYLNTWTVTMPGFTSIAVHFSDIEVEYDYDFVTVLDVSDNIVDVFTGTHSDVWSNSVSGGVIKVRLISDGSVTDWGFAVDSVLNGTAGDFSLENCTKVIDGYDFYNDDPDPMDDNSHGTHVAGTVAADGLLKGVAPDAQLLALKVCDASGTSCPGSAMIAAVDWCNVKSSDYNVVVTTMSLGDSQEWTNSTCPTWMDSSINAAHSLGIMVTVASGNDGYSNGINYPGCSQNAFSVGSTTKSDSISSFSNRGDMLDCFAPGSDIYSTLPGGGYGDKSGTSMATPHVAGAVALLKEYDPSLTPDQIGFMLKEGGVPIYDSANGLTFPRIDVLASISGIGIECEFDSDCGLDEEGDNYCEDGDVYVDFVDRGCSAENQCFVDLGSEKVEDCEFGCVEDEARCKIQVCNYGGCYIY